MTPLLFQIIQSPCLSSGKYLASEAINRRFFKPLPSKNFELCTTVISKSYTLLVADGSTAKLELCSQMRSSGSGQSQPPASLALVEAALLQKLLNCSHDLESKKISISQVKWCLMLWLLCCVTQKMTQNLHVFTHFILRRCRKLLDGFHI